ncbi:MAG TPA: LysR substrate-binding domain-containing protein [Ensifer sp.]|nr:LysR substrate-binding domain-containing protein [Ensifer sp.]
MRFQGLDLNLLVALDELLSVRNLTTAAANLNMSQPAMSAALARLRSYFNDEIFTMQGRRITPTPFAEALAEPVREALVHVKAAISTRHSFDPSLSTRRFRIALSDYAMLLLFTRVLKRVSYEAPKVTFDLRPFDDHPDELINRGEVDFLIFPDTFLLPELPSNALFEDRMVCVICQSNSEIGDQMTFSQYMSAGHVATQFGRSHKPSIEEWLLLKHGVKRRIEVMLQSFSMVPHFLVGTTRIATMCERLAVELSRALPLRILELPVPLPSFVEAMQWSQSKHNDPAVRWIRDIIFEEASALPRLHERQEAFVGKLRDSTGTVGIPSPT